jgi:trk system potassium uptake protein TrkH
MLVWAFRSYRTEFNHREGILLVILTWILAAVLGALPFQFSGYFGTFTDAFFESMSGFTTTGATILTDIEALPRSLLLWRSFTHWLGGMGIILLGIAILPLVGTGGMELYRAEFSGASSEKLKPRIAETAFALWKIYALLTAMAFLSLMVAGMGPFDAICHTFSTLGTGGFSTRNLSVEAFQSPAIEMVIVVFMFLAGINFTQHYRLLVQREPLKVLGDREILFYSSVTIVAILLVSLSLRYNASVPVGESLRLASFQVVSILTTTGYSSTNFETWAPFAQLILLALMFAGGCTGSTAGGLKIARIDLLTMVVTRDFRRIVERRGVFAVHYGKMAVPEHTIQSLLNLVYLAFLVNFAACLILTAFGVDVLTAIAAVAASMFNIGPGLGEVGPADNYAHFPAIVKWVLSMCMLAGRLEFYAFIVVLTPVFWQK